MTGTKPLQVHKVARVASIDLPDGTEIEARTGQMYEEGWETEYSVFEHVPRPQTPADDEEAENTWPGIIPTAGRLWVPPDPDYRDPALQMDLESVRVHQVRRVEIETVEYRVARHRWEKPDPNEEFPF